MSDVDLEQARAKSAFVCDRGEAWVARKKAEFDALPKGTVVIIDIDSGDYVTARTWLIAHPIFRQRFGTGALGFVHRVAEHTFIGGGIA